MTVEMEDIEYHYSSGSDDGDENEHKRLLAAISKLDKRKRVLPSERREPSIQVSEFHLTKEGSDSNAVSLGNLAKSLKIHSTHGDIARKLKAAQRKSKVLPKPLEKPVAERITRGVAFENTKTQLSQWDPVVSHNRAADHLEFPLKSSETGRIDVKDFLDPNQAVTDLEKEMAAVLNGSPSVQKEREENEEFPLSLEEMIERRKELAKLRVQESYRQVKAHRQKKIKSKKYHRFARRERIRNQIKEFEELQQKDPEEALRRLEEIEKERALERVSLRHRSTGQWAKNQAVRAKYDKESRQVLSEQLKLSKQLTQKVQVESESSDEEPPTLVEEVPSSDNPWISQPKTEADIDEFLGGYRKYWNEKKLKESQQKLVQGNEPQTDKIDGDADENMENQPHLKAMCMNAVESYTEIQNPNISSDKKSDKISKKLENSKPSSKTKSLKDSRKLTSGRVNTPNIIKSAVKCTGGKWAVTSLEEPTTLNEIVIDDIFDALNDKISEKAQKKISDMKRDFERQLLSKSESSLKKKRGGSDDESDIFKMKKQRLQIDLDEKLDENPDENSGLSNGHGDHFLKLAPENVQVPGSKSKKTSTVTELDPNKFITTGPTRLHTALPDEITGGDEGMDDSDPENEKHLTISEAFADDDVIADFSEEKKDALEKDKPEDINLHLPGWGDWAGHNIQPSKRKKKTFLIKAPELPPRRDENKGNLIINESEDAAARDHQVSELPFPFTSVKDFEASVRAPISSTFIPETAYRKLIKPAVKTEIGSIITPMGKDVLLNQKKKKKVMSKKIV